MVEITMTRLYSLCWHCATGGAEAADVLPPRRRRARRRGRRDEVAARYIDGRAIAMMRDISDAQPTPMSCRVARYPRRFLLSWTPHAHDDSTYAYLPLAPPFILSSISPYRTILLFAYMSNH